MQHVQGMMGGDEPVGDNDADYLAVLAEFTGDKQAAAKLARLEAAGGSGGGGGGGAGRGGGGGALTKKQLQGQINKLKKATVAAHNEGDMPKAAAMKKRCLELMEQQKTAPDVAAPAPPPQSMELGDDGEVRDDDPMLLDLLGEIGLAGGGGGGGGAVAAPPSDVPTKEDVRGLKRKAVELLNSGDVAGARALQAQIGEMEDRIKNPHKYVTAAPPPTMAEPEPAPEVASAGPSAEEQRVAGEFQLQAAWLADPTAVELLVSNAALDDERGRVVDEIAATLGRGLGAPPALQEKESQIAARLEHLAQGVQSGTLSIPDYITALDQATHRDRRLADALAALGRHAQVAAVRARIQLNDGEADAARTAMGMAPAAAADDAEDSAGSGGGGGGYEEAEPPSPPAPAPAPVPPPRVMTPRAPAPAPAPAPPAKDVAQIAEYRAQIDALKGQAVQHNKSGQKREAMTMLKQAKAVEVQWAALEYELEEGWLTDPNGMELLADCSAALEAEKAKLTETMMASLSQGEPAPQPVQERMAAVQGRLKGLTEQMEAGELTMDMWLQQLKRSIARDERLQAALTAIKKNKDAEVVAARLTIANEEADALIADGAKLEEPPAADEDDGMTAEERAELEAELAEMDDLEELEDDSGGASTAPPPVVAAPAVASGGGGSSSDVIGATAEAAHKAAQLDRCKEARAAAFGQAEKAMAQGDSAQATKYVTMVEKLDGAIAATSAQLEELQALASQERTELQAALARASESVKALLASGEKAGAMAALQEAESLKAQIKALDSPIAAIAAPPTVAATLAPTVSKTAGKKALTQKQNEQYDQFASLLEKQAAQSSQRVKEFQDQGQVEAAAAARANYDMDRLSLQRLAEYRANCVTKLPKDKTQREYVLTQQKGGGQSLRSDQLEIGGLIGTQQMDASTFINVKLLWPDSDAPQVKKTSTEKAGGTQDYTSAGQGVVFEINRGSGRKDFPGRLERRQLIEFELMSSGWLKSEPLGVGSWGNLTGLMGESEVEGTIQIKDPDRNVVNTLQVVARVSEPFNGGDADGGIETINDGIKWVILDQVAAKQAIIGARFSGQPTEPMKVVAKKHKLNPVWLADPTNIQLIESNCGLDLELEKLKAAQDACLSAGREVPFELENKLQAITKKMAELGDKFKSGDPAKAMRAYHKLLVKACERDAKLLQALAEMGLREGAETVQQRLQRTQQEIEDLVGMMKG